MAQDDPVCDDMHLFHHAEMLRTAAQWVLYSVCVGVR